MRTTLNSQQITLNRLPPHEVERLHRVLGGDPTTEELILQFIVGRYRAKSLFYLPAAVATAALKRPADFIREAKRYSQPELPI